MALGWDEGADFGLEITGDLLPFIVFVLSQGFLVGSGVVVEEALEITGSESSFLSSFCSVSIVDPFSAILLLLASRALISSIKPLPPKGRGPFPRPVSVLDEVEFTPVAFPPPGKGASSIRDTFLSFAPAIAAASPVNGRLSSDMDPAKNPDAGRGGAGGGGGGGGAWFGSGGGGGGGGGPEDGSGGGGGGPGGGGSEAKAWAGPGGSGGGGGGAGGPKTMPGGAGVSAG